MPALILLQGGRFSFYTLYKDGITGVEKGKRKEHTSVDTHTHTPPWGISHSLFLIISEKSNLTV